MKKLISFTIFTFLVGFSSIRIFAADPYPPISDQAASTCPPEDSNRSAGDYPFPEERSTVYLQPSNSKTGTLSLTTGVCDNFQTNLTTCVTSNTLRFNYQGSSCPKRYNKDSDGCYLDTPVGSTSTPSLDPGIYFVHDLATCWSTQSITVDKVGCVVNDNLSCGGQSLSTNCSGSSISPHPPPPPAYKDLLLKNGAPVQGKTCATEISTPIEFPKDFCAAGGGLGTLQIQPKSVRVPGAQDTGQYLAGQFDLEHLLPSDINQYYDQTVVLPFDFLGIPGVPKTKSASKEFDLGGPVSRLAPELEQDRLRHEFISWLCEKNGDATQGRIPKSLNTRYVDKWPSEWLIQAPFMGSQIWTGADAWVAGSNTILNYCRSFPPLLGMSQSDWDSKCQFLYAWFRGVLIANRERPITDFSNPIRYKPCEIYAGKSWPNLRLGPIDLPSIPGMNFVFPVGDVYAKKMASQCKRLDGSTIPFPLCIKGSMYRPNMIEGAIWSRVPLFANEESKGEITLQVCNSDPAKYIKIPVAVPQVFRLASASAFLQQMLLSSTDNQKNKQATQFVTGTTIPDNTCLNCQDAQNGPPDTETFINYTKGYGDSTRGDVLYAGGGASAHSDKDTVTVRNNIPFLLNIWYQTAGGPFGIFNIFRPYRQGEDKTVDGLFQPTGKPFSGDSSFLDTPGSSLVQYSGDNIKKDVWKLLYSKIAGVWNAKNWIMQSVAPFCLKELKDCPGK